MPLYEFFCPDCNTIFTFFSKTVTTDNVPPCPKSNNHRLSRMVSRFAVTGRAQEPGPASGNGDGPDPKVDMGRMEKAMETLASEAEGMDESDPRKAADLMRRFSSMTGLRLGDKMEDALSRLEAGEDPESLEKDMEGLEEKDLFKIDGAGEGSGKKNLSARKKAPLRDDTLYEM
ncbi:MAG: FmdB family zinc ribbon protein [Chitinispirillaceae bacterium]|jgi:putative FmdB family regulatory protein